MEQNNILKKIDQFADNWSKKNPDKSPGYCHNIYYLVSEDRDGNITDEGYAMNCTTNFAMNHNYVNGQSDSIGYIYIGQSDTIPTPDSSAMISPLSGHGTTVNGYNYPEYKSSRFYHDTGLYVSTFLVCVNYFDYTQYDENKTITEIGVGDNGTTDLWLHAHVYDDQGNPSSFVKKVNEKLTVFVYTTLTCPIGDIISRNEAKGIISALRPECFNKINSYSQNFNSLAMMFLPIHHDRYRGWTSRNVYAGDEFSRNFTNNIATSQRSSNFIANRDQGFFDGTYTYISQMFVGTGFDREYSYNFYNGCNALMLQPIKLSSPEKITCYNLFTDNYDTTAFTRIFGYGTNTREHRIDGHIPAIDFDISGTDAGMWMYNCQTKDWDIAETFVNMKNNVYDFEYIVWSIQMKNQYIDFYQEYNDYRVYINPRTDIPITAFTNIRGVTVYATDTYWDPQTWVAISNLSSIDVALQTKRYYCIIGKGETGYSSQYPLDCYGNNYYRFRTVRNYTPHSITPVESYSYCDFGDKAVSYNDHISQTWKAVTGDTYGYIACGEYLVYPDTNDPNPTTYRDASATDNHFWYRYPISGVDNNQIDQRLIWNTNDGNVVVTQGTSSWKKGFRAYTVNIDPTIAPTYNDYLFTDIGGEEWGSEIPHWTTSCTTGFVAMSYKSGSKNVDRTYIFDMYGGQNNDTPTLYFIDGYRYANIVGSTNYICGVNASVTDHLSLDVIDMKTQQVFRTIDIPEGYTFDGIAGFDNFVYIRVIHDSVVSTYVYRILEDELTATTLDFPQMKIYNYTLSNHIQLSVPANGNCESCMVMLTWDNSAAYNVLFKSSDPTHPIRIVDGGGDERQVGNYNILGELKYVNNNKQLLLSIIGRRYIVIDIGRVINEGTQSRYQTIRYNFPYDEDIRKYALCVYKNRAVLITPHLDMGSSGGSYYVKNAFYAYPIENWIPHKITGYTKTINTYNNPKIVNDGKGITIQVSNVAPQS